MTKYREKPAIEKISKTPTVDVDEDGYTDLIKLARYSLEARH